MKHYDLIDHVRSHVRGLLEKSGTEDYEEYVNNLTNWELCELLSFALDDWEKSK